MTLREARIARISSATSAASGLRRVADRLVAGDERSDPAVVLGNLEQERVMPPRGADLDVLDVDAAARELPRELLPSGALPKRQSVSNEIDEERACRPLRRHRRARALDPRSGSK